MGLPNTSGQSGRSVPFHRSDWIEMASMRSLLRAHFRPCKQGVRELPAIRRDHPYRLQNASQQLYTETDTYPVCP